jgi:hypothetical protein
MARLRRRVAAEPDDRLHRTGRLQRVLDGRRALAPEVIGSGRKRRLRSPLRFGHGFAPRFRTGRGPERHELVSRADPVAWKLQHVALGPSVVPALPSLRTFRFHGVCRPFVVGHADNIFGRR